MTEDLADTIGGTRVMGWRPSSWVWFQFKHVTVCVALHRPQHGCTRLPGRGEVRTQFAGVPVDGVRVAEIDHPHGDLAGAAGRTPHTAAAAVAAAHGHG
jgi:hypothetical protein